MNISNLRILFALQTVGHPRDSKRITMLQNAGFQVEAIAFARKLHKGRVPACSVEIIGTIEHGRYLKRMIKMMATVSSVRRAIKSNDVVYASGPDMALLCLISGMNLGRPIIIEVGDVCELQTAGGVWGRLVRKVDRYLADSCQLLITTAHGFLDYYRQWVGTTTRALIIENKLEPSETAEQHHMQRTATFNSVQNGRPLRIGYFGLLRCEQSWRILLSLAKKCQKNVEIVVAGYPIEPVDLPQQAEKYSNVIYKGEYRSPDDLPSLYHGIDLTWMLYPSKNDWEFRWVRANRFYESCFYQTPMVAQSGSADAAEIQRYGIGLIIENNGTDKIVDALSNITPEDMDLWRKNLAKVPPEVYLYTTEAEDLGKAIRDVVDDRIGSDGSDG